MFFFFHESFLINTVNLSSWLLRSKELNLNGLECLRAHFSVFVHDQSPLVTQLRNIAMF